MHDNRLTLGSSPLQPTESGRSALKRICVILLSNPTDNTSQHRFARDDNSTAEHAAAAAAGKSQMTGCVKPGAAS